jgi:hypothetical protein
MLNNILKIEGVSLLPKEQQRAINGGFIDGGGCGIKVNGVWVSVADDNGNGTTREEAEGAMWTTVNRDAWDPNTASIINVNGTVDGWCCDNCYWNQQ